MTGSLTSKIYGIAAAIAAAFIIGGILAGLIYFTSLKETLLSPLADFTLIISVFIGGFIAAQSFGHRGLINGLSVGAAIFVLIMLVSLIFDPDSLGLWPIVKNAAITLFAGTLGGIMGVGVSS
ncbi:MAG: TIGR04086 family membrane protein [Candidatus Saccharibacteria bacterium]